MAPDTPPWLSLHDDARWRVAVPDVFGHSSNYAEFHDRNHSLHLGARRRNGNSAKAAIHHHFKRSIRPMGTASGLCVIESTR